MANFHLEIGTISRGKCQSVTNSVSYISGEKLHDKYGDKICYHNRHDVLQCQIFLPHNAPYTFHHLQNLCYEIDKAERRYDARTAREFKGSLPNELSFPEQSRIVHEYISNNFTSHGLCAIAAIHEGRNEVNPKCNNPHVHIIVPTRSVGPDGFTKKKNREWNKREYINIWREDWANVQNRAYERNGLDIQISHESLEVQGIKDREPTIHLSQIDWQKEKHGVRTIAGDKKREIEKRNEERSRQFQAERELAYELELSR